MHTAHIHYCSCCVKCWYPRRFGLTGARKQFYCRHAHTVCNRRPVKSVSVYVAGVPPDRVQFLICCNIESWTYWASCYHWRLHCQLGRWVCLSAVVRRLVSRLSYPSNSLESQMPCKSLFCWIICRAILQCPSTHDRDCRWQLDFLYEYRCRQYLKFCIARVTNETEIVFASDES